MNWQDLTDMQVSLLQRAINTELNIISKHWTETEPQYRQVWEDQYNELNIVFRQIQAEDDRRTFLRNFPPATIEHRSELYK